MVNDKKDIADRHTGFGSQETLESIDSLRQTNRRQQAALQVKSRMIDNMAYQIRTLTNAIIGFSDLLLSEELSADQLDFAREINQAGKGLSELVNEVLDWARLESGRLQLVRSRCELGVIVSELDRITRPVAAEKGLAFEMNSNSTLPATIITDSERLLKCLVNLVANAIQYTEQGFVRVCVRTEVRDRLLYVRFDVADSGRGIPPEKIEKLFDPHIEDEDANAKVVMMLGRKLSAAAGLPLTRQLAELLGGTIEVQSQPGSGSTFSLLLPAGTDMSSCQNPEQPKEDSSDKLSVPAGQGNCLPILLVEDQESNRVVVRLMLEAMGYEVETAHDGVEAVDMAMSRQYSLIFMDLKMPRMDGCEATRCIRDKQNHVPIVALSAMVLNGEESKNLSDMFDGFLTKPIDSEQLSSAVRNYAITPVADKNTAGIS